MGKGNDCGRLDWLVELAGAIAPGAAAAFAAARLAPVHGWPVGIAILIGFGAAFALAFAAIRAVPAEPRLLPLAEFHSSVSLDATLLLDDPLFEDELLLDSVYSPLDVLLLDQVAIGTVAQQVAELLLDDPLPLATPDSRVVQLFADGRMPTAGQLQQRIARHLAGGDRRGATDDATDALGEALAELRRSLRQA